MIRPPGLLPPERLISTERTWNGSVETQSTIDQVASLTFDTNREARVSTFSLGTFGTIR